MCIVDKYIGNEMKNKYMTSNLWLANIVLWIQAKG